MFLYDCKTHSCVLQFQSNINAPALSRALLRQSQLRMSSLVLLLNITAHHHQAQHDRPSLTACHHHRSSPLKTCHHWSSSVTACPERPSPLTGCHHRLSSLTRCNHRSENHAQRVVMQPVIFLWDCKTHSWVLQFQSNMNVAVLSRALLQHSHCLLVSSLIDLTSAS